MPRFDVTIAGELNLDLILYGVPDELPPERELLANDLMEWTGSTRGVYGAELQRYRGFVLATTLVGARSSKTTQAIASRLIQSRDEQVRGYAAWLMADADVAFDVGEQTDGVELASAFAVGAALARHHARDDLAKLLDVRASKVLAAAGTSPYRS